MNAVRSYFLCEDFGVLQYSDYMVDELKDVPLTT